MCVCRTHSLLMHLNVHRFAVDPRYHAATISHTVMLFPRTGTNRIHVSEPSEIFNVCRRHLGQFVIRLVVGACAGLYCDGHGEFLPVDTAPIASSMRWAIDTVDVAGMSP
jgi:hypothetical protein